MGHHDKIPRPTVKRLSLYLRELETQVAGGGSTINSRKLGEALDLTDAQVRKDLAYFGQFGHPGVGYRVDELIGELRHILGTDRAWRVAVVGSGNIGRAVSSYGRLNAKGFTVAAVFDNDASVVGTTVAGCTVQSVEELDATVRERGIEIAILAVPAPVAQEVATRLEMAGIRGIMNFAPVRLNLDRAVSVVSVDLTLSLEQLAFKMTPGPAAETD